MRNIAHALPLLVEAVERRGRLSNRADRHLGVFFLIVKHVLFPLVLGNRRARTEKPSALRRRGEVVQKMHKLD